MAQENKFFKLTPDEFKIITLGDLLKLLDLEDSFNAAECIEYLSSLKLNAEEGNTTKFLTSTITK